MLLMLGEEKVGSFLEITRKITLNDFPKILHKILNNPPDISWGVVQVIFFAFTTSQLTTSQTDNSLLN